MKRNDDCCTTKQGKIQIVGWVYASSQNGIVLNPLGVCPALNVGAHSGVEPKIRLIYDK